MAGHLGARQSVFSRLSPLTLSRISVGFALIAALWLAVASVHGAVIALIAALAVVVCGYVGRVLAGLRSVPAVEWGQAGCGMVAEFLVYAGIGTAASVHRVLPAGLAGTPAAGLGGPGSAGVWHLTLAAAILTLVTAMTDLCVHGSVPDGSRLRLFGPPGDVRLPLACLAVLLFGARAGLLVVLVLGVAALVVVIADGAGQGGDRSELRGYRGDGRISVWIGRWVGGRVPPLAPLFVGLLVTGVLTALGLRNLSGILLLTPVEAMLLAAFASWHPHDGRSDWLVPPLIQAAEYVFIAEIGFAGHVWPPLTFTVVAAVGLRHMDLAYRVRGGLATGVDRRGLGWEGRMIVVGTAAAIGIAPFGYVALGLYLWWRLTRDWMIGWSTRLMSRMLHRRSAAEDVPARYYAAIWVAYGLAPVSCHRPPCTAAGWPASSRCPPGGRCWSPWSVPTTFTSSGAKSPLSATLWR
jgi:Family of unknown function (DUF5941)